MKKKIHLKHIVKTRECNIMFKWVFVSFFFFFFFFLSKQFLNFLIMVLIAIWSKALATGHLTHPPPPVMRGGRHHL
jgi:hypothetical protein